jgi:hypothetical protein
LTEEKKCERCKTIFFVTNPKLPHSIDERLCTTCLVDWLAFFDKFDNYYSAKFPKKQNPTWEAFIGDIADIGKERVEFT